MTSVTGNREGSDFQAHGFFVDLHVQLSRCGLRLGLAFMCTDAWCMVHGAWCMVHGAQLTLPVTRVHTHTRCSMADADGSVLSI